MGIFSFWWDCIKWAFWRWESAYRMLTTFVIFLGLLGVGGIAFATWANQIMALIAVVPIVITLVFIAPYKLWKEKADVVKRMTTKRLKVEVEKKPEPEPAENKNWWHLIVRNTSKKSIKGCYGQVVSFEPNLGNRSYRGLRLPWSLWVTRERERYTIPGNTSGNLDFVVASPDYFSVIALSEEAGKAKFPYLEGHGTYKVEIQVGSEQEDFPATKIKVRIGFEEGEELN
jgi:hypothetical protein